MQGEATALWPNGEATKLTNILPRHIVDVVVHQGNVKTTSGCGSYIPVKAIKINR